MATVLITAEAREQFLALPLLIQQRIERIFVRLEQWPAVSGARPLRGSLAGQYRIRTGDYRIQFQVSGELITVVKVGHRDRFYEE